MRRRARTNLVLAALVTALLVVGIETLRHEYQRVESKNAPLVVLDPVDILSLYIERGEQPPVRLEQHNGDWRMTAPMELPADHLRVTRLTDELRFQHARKVDAAGSSRDNFGVDEAVVRITIETAHTTHTVAYGTYHPIENQHYIALDDHIYLIESGLYQILQAQDLFMAEHYLLPRDFHPAVIIYRDQRIPLAMDPNASGPSRAAWEHARALTVEPATDAAAGEAFFVESADGRRILLHRQPGSGNLQLSNPELGIRYQLQSGVSAELFPPEDDAGTAGG